MIDWLISNDGWLRLRLELCLGVDTILIRSVGGPSPRRRKKSDLRATLTFRQEWVVFEFCRDFNNFIISTPSDRLVLHPINMCVNLVLHLLKPCSFEYIILLMKLTRYSIVQCHYSHFWRWIFQMLSFVHELNKVHLPYTYVNTRSS